MAYELPSVEQPRFSLSEFESLAQSSFSPTALNSDVFTFEHNEGLVLQQEVLGDDFTASQNNDTMIVLDDPMEFAPESFDPETLAPEGLMLDHGDMALSIDIEAAQQISPHASVSSNPTSPPLSEEDSGNASDESSTYDPSNAASMEAGFDVDLTVPRAEKRELQARPFAKRSKGNFYEDMTSEEQRLIEREGFHFPNRELTKAEEKQLKKLRRKVKNKISAQDSRKRRKEYVTKLEGNIKQAASANTNLKGKVTSLEKQNQSLLDQLRALQAQLQRKIGGGAASTGTALMLLGLCFSMFASPDALAGAAPSLPSLSSSGATPSFASRTLKSLPDISATTWSVNSKPEAATIDDEFELDPVLAAQLDDLMATLSATNSPDELAMDDNATDFDDDQLNSSTVGEPMYQAIQDRASHLLDLVSVTA
jgi:cyclic AMP-responsive element-binding protein 3